LNSNVTSSKADWRFWAKKTRSGLPDVSSETCEHLEAFLAASDARVVLAYKAFGSEIPLEPLVETLPNLEFWTTRVNPSSRLSLHPFASATTRNKFGMLEPEMSEPELEPELVDVVLVPGLVFDRFGTRLGYGAGFYDRLLPKLRSNAALIGVTHDALLLEHPLPKDGLDVSMTHLVTESDLILCQQNP
jgi:5-formyltetrahydrofolate cyclo-ligase